LHFDRVLLYTFGEKWGGNCFSFHFTHTVFAKRRFPFP
jgi:light-regulated signal transduction histidine kinase (bacteriophytochrome)